MRDVLQEYFDKYMEPITGGTADINLSSHGRAFVAGWVAAMEYLKKENVNLTS